MERLCKEDRKDLVWAMRKSLLEQVNTGVLTESADASARNFILNEATYEQLLNLCFNENREEKYLPAGILEQVAVGVYENFVKALEEKKDEKKEDKKEEKKEDKKEVKESVVTEDEVKTVGYWKGKYEALKNASKTAGNKVVAATKRTGQFAKSKAGIGIAAGTAGIGAGIGTAKYLHKRAQKKAEAAK